MEFLVPASLLLGGVIHLLPVSGALGARRLSSLYGVRTDDPSHRVLLRHRAVLFGILGSLLTAAALLPSLRTAAFLAGIVSLVSFLWLAIPVPARTSQITRVIRVDVVTLLVLAVGLVVHLRAP